jgi:thioredoxin-dependent peroxiredoxin
MLKKGKKAPAFTGINQDGEPVSLKDYLGKTVVLFFYPKDNTPGCTEQACNLRDNYAALQKKGLVLLGISVDTAKKHTNFISKYDLPFPLIADTEKKIVEQYEVWGEKTFWGKKYMGIFRTTFIINADGKIEHIIDEVDTANHAEQILTLLKK